MTQSVIIACDFPSGQECIKFLDRFSGDPLFVKVGMELFYAEGPSIVEAIKKRGHKIFLDLKLHDIPHTVEKAMARLRNMGVDMVNVHAAGGKEMMEAALRGLCDAQGKHPYLLAVTQLTSTSQQMMQEELLIPSPLEEVVARYAKNAKDAGLDGVICSPLESQTVHSHCGSSFLTVTPGIRFPEGDRQDQKRVTSPEMAKELGSDFIVMGRAITQSSDPVAAYHRAVKEFCEK